MKITFHGAALNVTGSKHLVETGGLRILLDCGLFQGKRSVVGPKNRELPFDPKTIDAVLLSHAHADHSGQLPLLVKNGFAGKIYATPATCDIAEYIMMDSAHIQAQDAEYFNSHLPEGETPIEPLYSPEDVREVVNFFSPTPYFLHTGHWTALSPTVRFKFLDAGHILGSSIIVLETKENGQTKTIAFSGDLGAKRAPILRDPEIPQEQIDVLVLECTYGNRKHAGLSEARQKLAHLVKKAVAEKLKIIVPAFSLGRTQELIYILHKLTDQNEIPRIPIYIDSPLASNITGVFQKYEEEYDEESKKDFARTNEEPFVFRNLTYTTNINESKALNEKEGPWMVISASGMCEAGRILHHLKNHIGDPKTVVVFTGYQAEHTLGRKILEGKTPVKIFGHWMDVKAHIEVFNEFSAHADQDGLVDFAKKINPKKLCLVHTEYPQAETFTQIIKEKSQITEILTPEENEVVEI